MGTLISHVYIQWSHHDNIQFSTFIHELSQGLSHEKLHFDGVFSIIFQCHSAMFDDGLPVHAVGQMFFLQKSPAWRWKFQYPKIANVCFVEDPENLAKDPKIAKDSQIWWSFDVLKIANVKIIKFGPGTPNLTWSRNPNLWLTKPQIWQLVF